MKTSEILEAAAQHQAEHGHCKGSLKDEEGRMCLQGAILYACGARTFQRFLGQVEPDYSEFDYDEFVAANRTVATVLLSDGIPVRGGATHHWNDEESTSSEDVILTLKRAAELAREKEDASTHEHEETAGQDEVDEDPQTVLGLVQPLERRLR